MSISESQIRYFLNSLWMPKSQKGLLLDNRFEQARLMVEQVDQAAMRFWQDVAFARPANGDETFRLGQPDMITNTLAPMLIRLAQQLDHASDITEDENEIMEIKAHRDRANDLALQLTNLVEQSVEHFVYYAHVPNGRGTMSLSANPYQSLTCCAKNCLKIPKPW